MCKLKLFNEGKNINSYVAHKTWIFSSDRVKYSTSRSFKTIQNLAHCLIIITESENLPLLKEKKTEAFQLSVTV